MSQAKVDKYKKEKKNRAKMIKRQHARRIAGLFILVAVIGCAIGFPLGRKLYKISVEHRNATATVSTELYPYWMQQYWSTNYSGYWASEDTASDTDVSATDATTGDAAESDTTD